MIRYAGKLGGLYPQDNLLGDVILELRLLFILLFTDFIKCVALKADEILDACEDLINALSPSLREQDPEKKVDSHNVLVIIILILITIIICISSG